MLFRLLPIILAIPTLQAQLLTVADFETGDLTQLSVQKGSKEAISLVAEPVRHGRRAAKSFLRLTDSEVSKGRRAEFSDNRTKVEMNKDYWYGLSLFLPSDFKTPLEKDAVLFQWHTQQGGPSPVLAIRVKGDDWVITSNAVLGKRRTLKRLPVERNRWTDWVVHVRWAADATGYWTIWKDGIEVFSEKSIVTQYPEALGPYAKFGQYHSVDEKTPQNTVYMDE